MRRIILIEINKLKPHEAVNSQHLRKLVSEIKKEGKLKNPVVVDKKSLVVLDGHHRLEALKILGCRKIPVFLVNYKSKEIRVYLRRKELLMKLIKEAVISRGKNGKLFPYKTTRHLLKKRPKGINVDLKELK
jgi:ParB-like chromosome segregation protein Spo0J